MGCQVDTFFEALFGVSWTEGLVFPEEGSRSLGQQKKSPPRERNLQQMAVFLGGFVGDWVVGLGFESRGYP